MHVLLRCESSAATHKFPGAPYLRGEQVGRVRNRQEKTWGSKQGDSEVGERSHGKQVKAKVDSTPKAHTRLPDDALASGVQNCGCGRAGEVYTAVAQDTEMETLAPTAREGIEYVETKRSEKKCV
jgi:hypothetical protein